MGIWIELHCDKMSTATDLCGRCACLSGSGNQPGYMVRLKSDVPQVVNQMIETALKNGWVKEGKDMICPVCAKHWKEFPDG